MQFGTLAGNDTVNTRIYDTFDQIDPADVPLFVRKFRTEREPQLFHTYRELIVGGHLRSIGLNARYEQRVQDKTPDWVVYDSGGDVQELFDVTSMHQRRETNMAIGRAVAAGEFWNGWATIPPDHIYSKIQIKASAYSCLSAEIGKPYTLFFFGEFTTTVSPEEVAYVLYEHHGGLLKTLPMLSGLVYFSESGGVYSYHYHANPAAAFPSSVVPALGRQTAT